MRHSATQSELYTQVSKGGQGIRMHTALLGNDGWVVAFGNSDYGQCMIPPLTLEPGIVYTQVSANLYQTVLLRSDGCAVACGQNDSGQCNFPPLDEAKSYTQASAGGFHTVLLRQDGNVVACGDNVFGQCSIPLL